MFKKKYKYFISFWYQLENGEFKMRDGYMVMNKPINEKEHIPQIRLELKSKVEQETNQICVFLAIINWKKLK